MHITFDNYDKYINELGTKKILTEFESKQLARALTLEKIVYDCTHDYGGADD